MPIKIQAVYEDGKLRPLDPLELEEHSVVLVSVEPVSNDSVRSAWHEQSRRSLMQLWDNEADDVYNALLTRKVVGRISDGDRSALDGLLRRWLRL